MNDGRHPAELNGGFELTDRAETQTYNLRDARTDREVEIEADAEVETEIEAEVESDG